MIIIVTGGRNFNDLKAIESKLTRLYELHGKDITLYHGDCRGVDKLCAATAKDFDWQVKAFPAKWIEYGKAAGPIRNKQMLEEALKTQEKVLLCPFPGNAGTANCIACAKTLEIEIFEESID